ncbi:TIGR01777 family oxidoreductase [Flavobacteriaceae bacterium F89]|uniref:TIGR01777 family oxidoreductase n=1 Tax=Cerina litoralis TaxID=2874477 RepID=A0AAE3EUQ9_9FLAO|nr:TIGR01777 family oxidoreductase [Cerina litoralis]MCG2460624.1 TIGR01777 family oxidoreductase [Cerina litoralis]
MKVLITGATGLVGKAIVALCLENQIAVNYLSTSKKKIVSHPNYRGFLWDPMENKIDQDCFEGVTAIINLAGSSISKRWTARNKRRILLSRTQSLQTLYQGLEKVGAGNITSFVTASAIGIYPDSVDHYYGESYKGVDQSFLGEVVQLWEREADTFDKMGLPVAKIRTGLVLSEKGGALPKIAKPIKNYIGSAFGSGAQWQSWIHIQDLARIYLFAVEHKLQGAYNAVAPNPVTNAKLTKRISEVLERPLWMPNIPRFVARLILGEMSYLLYSSQRVSCKKLEEEGYNFDFSNVCTALKELYLQKNPKKSSVETEYGKEFV